jgi:beta-lactamase class D
MLARPDPEVPMLARALSLLLLSLNAWAAEPVWQEHPDWKPEFTDRNVTGTALIYDEQADRYDVFDRARAETAFLPASTFKVFNALVALDTGAAKDEYEVIRWDGVKRQFDGWNRDHSLASAMKFSVVWFYQEMARRAGQLRMQKWIDKVAYGNRDIGGGIDRFWLSGKLRISAAQQIEFLRRLARGELPFSARAQEAVRRITIVDAAPDYIEHGKTGWAPRDDNGHASDLGWYVGWIERAGKRWFFALNIDMPNGGGDTAKRQAIMHALLAQMGAIPAGTE